MPEKSNKPYVYKLPYQYYQNVESSYKVDTFNLSGYNSLQLAAYQIYNERSEV